MKKKIIFFIFLTIISQSVSFWKANNMCFSNRTRNSSCYSRTHTFRCDLYHCSVDIQSCEIFTKLKFFQKLGYMNQKTDIKRILSGIGACYKVPYVWESASVCLKNDFCNKKYPVSLRRITHGVFRNSFCRCKGKYIHYCKGNFSNFCSTDLQSCQKFPQKFLNKTLQINHKFERC